AWSFSPDGGYSWATPVHINKTPRRPNNPLFQQALIPSVTVAADSTIVVTYYDFRRDRIGASTDMADYFAVSCNIITSADACQSGGDWGNEVRLTDTSFDWDMAPYASGLFLGDYMGLKANGQTVWPVFGQVVRPQQTDLFTRSINVPAMLRLSSR
ncbi:MAG: exo-alpha-sialidase, partial [Gaiellaceae bacterium]